jgi:hypothetical protein
MAVAFDFKVGDQIEFKARCELGVTDAPPHVGTVVEVFPEQQRIVAESGSIKVTLPVRVYDIRKIYSERV